MSEKPAQLSAFTTPALTFTSCCDTPRSFNFKRALAVTLNPGESYTVPGGLAEILMSPRGEIVAAQLQSCVADGSLSVDGGVNAVVTGDADCEAAIAQLEDDVAKAVEKITVAEDGRASAEAANADLTEKLAAAEAANADLTTQVTDLTEKLTDAEKQINDLLSGDAE